MMRALSLIVGGALIALGAFGAAGLYRLAHPKTLGEALVASYREGRRAALSPRRRLAGTVAGYGICGAIVTAGILLVLP